MIFRPKHPADYFTLTLVVWIGLYILVNLLPQSWFLNYTDYHASDVCRDDMQELTGIRTVPIKLDANGVDRLWSYERNKYIDRIEWEGAYLKGETNSSWKELITAPAGRYRWDTTSLWVKLPLFLRVHIDGVSTNDFEVSNCK